MKKSIKILSWLLTAAIPSVAMVGCGGQNVGGATEKGKTNLYVATYDGGFGADWIEDVVKDFEELYSDYQNGDKVGVKVHVTKSTKTGQTIYNSMSVETNDIYYLFFQDNYYNFVNSDYLLDITDIVTENIADQGHSILSVMDEQLAQYYGVEKGGSTKYYSIPYSICYYSFAYDAELFYNEGLFLTREYDKNGNNGDVADYLIEKVSDSNRVYANLVTEGSETYYKTLKGDYGCVSVGYIRFLNKLASALHSWAEEELGLTNIKVTGMAYHANEAAPTVYDAATDTYNPIDETVVFDENLCMWYAPHNSDYQVPFDDADSDVNKKDIKALKSWGALSSNLLMWTYPIANYSQPIMFYDTFGSMQRNYQLMVQNNTLFLLENGHYNSDHLSGFYDLKVYLSSKLTCGSGDF